MSLVHGYSSTDEEQENAELKQKATRSTDQIQKAYGNISNTRPESFKVGNAIVSKESFDDAVFDAEFRKSKRGTNEKDTAKANMKRRKKGSVEDDTFQGPWARFDESSDEDELKNREQKEEEDEYAVKVVVEEPAESESEEEIKETTKFYGKEEFDYQGRTYIHVPLGYKKQDHKECFVPKKKIKTLSGHRKGVTKLELFPNSNHLLLSSGNDSKIFLWSMITFELLRGFFGHNKPIRDINFNNDGTKFLSASYDKTVLLWDTATGEILKSFQFKATPNCVRFNPFNNDEFLMGLSNNKIQQHCISTDTIVQTYDHHLGSINDLLFLKSKEQRFISTSEDKTIRVWDLGVNIPIKLISDITLHSMPVLRLHPTENCFHAQSMDNTIKTFSTKDRFKTNKRRVFLGHNCAGYGIGFDISPDGKYVISGDSNGYFFVWDWKTCKLLREIKCENQTISRVIWNEREGGGRVIMGGASGKIHFYD